MPSALQRTRGFTEPKRKIAPIHFSATCLATARIPLDSCLHSSRTFAISCSGRNCVPVLFVIETISPKLIEFRSSEARELTYVSSAFKTSLIHLRRPPSYLTVISQRLMSLFKICYGCQLFCPRGHSAAGKTNLEPTDQVPGVSKSLESMSCQYLARGYRSV